MNTPGSDIDAPSLLAEALKLDNIVKIFYVDDTITNSEVEKVVSDIREQIASLKEDDKFKAIFHDEINWEIPDDDILFTQLEGLVRADESLSTTLAVKFFKDEGESNSDIESELNILFKNQNFNSYHPKDAQEAINDYITSHNEGRILFLFDFDFGEGMRTSDIKNGAELILKLWKQHPEKRSKMIFAIITHLVKQGEEVEKRPEYVNGELGKLKPVPFLLSKSRKNNHVLLADGIKKTLLNRLVEIVKDETIKVLEEAFSTTKSLLETLDTYEFEHIVAKSSFAEGIWMGKTIKRLSTVLFENSINTEMVKAKYVQYVNPIFEDIIEFSKIKILSSFTEKPYNHREFLRYSELYTNGVDINELNEPLVNGDIFEIDHNTTPHLKGSYILVAQDCDIMLRSNGTRNRRQRFFSLLPIEIRTRAEVDADIIKIATEKKENNHYMASKFILPYYTQEDYTKIGVVNFNNELLVHIDVLDLVSINKSGQANYDYTAEYPVNEFSHSLRERYTSLIKTCKKFDKDISNVTDVIKKLPQGEKDKITSKFVKTLSPISEDKGAKNPYIGSNKFEFGAQRIKRLRKEYAAILLSKYTNFISRAAVDHDFASE